MKKKLDQSIDGTLWRFRYSMIVRSDPIGGRFINVPSSSFIVIDTILTESYRKDPMHSIFLFDGRIVFLERSLIKSNSTKVER